MDLLNENRSQIDAIDLQIRQLFLKRLEVAEQVAATKLASGKSVYNPERESQLIQQLCVGLPRDIALPYASFLRQTVQISRERQYQYLLAAQPERFPFSYQTDTLNPASVCYQGISASFSHLASCTLFPHAEHRSVESFEAVFSAVAEGKADVGVVPMENSTAGTINEVYDLLTRYDLYINHAFAKTIDHYLCAPEGVSLSQITHVLSHPQALNQCRLYLANHGLTAVEALNTAVAAQTVQQMFDGHTAAICSMEAAKEYGLTILDANIHDRQDNQTRFVVVSPRLLHHPADDHISMAFHLPHTSGTLSSVLSLFADYGCNLTQLHARPLQTGRWEYFFYLDFLGSLSDFSIRALLVQLKEELPYVRLTGSYHIREE